MSVFAPSSEVTELMSSIQLKPSNNGSFYRSRLLSQTLTFAQYESWVYGPSRSTYINHWLPPFRMALDQKWHSHATSPICWFQEPDGTKTVRSRVLDINSYYVFRSLVGAIDFASGQWLMRLDQRPPNSPRRVPPCWTTGILKRWKRRLPSRFLSVTYVDPPQIKTIISMLSNMAPYFSPRNGFNHYRSSKCMTRPIKW